MTRSVQQMVHYDPMVGHSSMIPTNREAVNIIVAEHLNISLEKASRLVELGRGSSEICYVIAEGQQGQVMDTCTTKLPNASMFMLSMGTNGQMETTYIYIYVYVYIYIYMKKGADLLDFSKVLCGTTTTLRFGTWGIFMVMQSYTVDRSNEYDTSGMSFRPLPFFKTSIMSWLRFGIHWAGSWLCVCVSQMAFMGPVFSVLSQHLGRAQNNWPPIMTWHNQEFVWYASWVFVKPQ